ncbi:MAG: aminoacyl-tRNA hydrolase, partial [Candidatus Krumholzibacteriia bacterium]
GDLLVTCAAERSQLQNRELARARLAELVRRALVPPKPRRQTKPTRAAKERRLQDKKQQSERKRRRRGPVED